jgi:hypothetical protein
MIAALHWPAVDIWQPTAGMDSVRLRPFTTLTRTVDDHRSGKVVTFGVRKPGYTVASSFTCRAVIVHIAPRKEKTP